MTSEIFDEQYGNLNKIQKEAVDSIDGPVMVVAGPGTGKTQVLALRIGNILKKTDTSPDGVLCLTFTNSGVTAMRDRLRKYIGKTASRVNISTFHSFGMKIIEEFYSSLDLDRAPKLLDDTESISICDDILQNNEWQYIRPRSEASRYFNDLKSLISLLKRERMTPEDFLIEIERDIKNLETNEESISTRGETKGQLKKDVLKKIESLNRTREVVRFYELYEEEKKNRNMIDYDDVMEFALRIIDQSSEAKDDIRERYLYILIDEHQDSSGVQNEFLQKVWGDTEKPNIFVVGDDRQLIYGFGGASISYFEGFKNNFGKAKLITLVDNYRSTQVILDCSHLLLESTLTKEKLVSHHKESHPIKLNECDYPRDEIIASAIDIKEKVKKHGIDLNDCAILVPKNRQVRSAVAILRDMDLSVSSNALRLFDSSEAQSFIRILKIINNPYDNAMLAESFFDKLSGVEPLDAHKFIKEHDMKTFSLVGLLEEKEPSLFDNADKVWSYISNLCKWLKKSQTEDAYSIIQLIGDEFLLEKAEDHEDLVYRVEVIRTILHLVLSQLEKSPKLTLKEFIFFIDRLESYGEGVELAVFGINEGIKVMTLHASKGLEFDYVWIAHLDEKSLVGGRHQGFTLPEKVEEKVEKKDEETTKRQLYVAITRAKRFCSLSYAVHSYTGGDQELAHIVADLPEDLLEKQSSSETEKMILNHDPKIYVEKKPIEKTHTGLNELVKIVAKEYESRNVSVSLLNNFFECPWKWYFRNLLQLPESKSDSLEFGNAVHSTIDKILKMTKVPTDEEVENMIDEKKDALGIVLDWVKNRLPKINELRQSEKSISLKDDKFPHLNIYGKLDLIENLSEVDIRVTDFKTGNARKKSEIEKVDEEGRMSGYMRQLAMYSYLLERNPRWETSVSESCLEFVEAKDPKEYFYKTSIDEEKINLLIKDISDYDDLVKSGEWISRTCNYNSYGKNTECEYCKKAEIYNSLQG